MYCCNVVHILYNLLDEVAARGFSSRLNWVSYWAAPREVIDFSCVWRGADLGDTVGHGGQRGKASSTFQVLILGYLLFMHGIIEFLAMFEHVSVLTKERRQGRGSTYFLTSLKFPTKIHLNLVFNFFTKNL